MYQVLAWAAATAAAVMSAPCLATTVSLYSLYNPASSGETVVIEATIVATSPLEGALRFLDNGAPTSTCDSIYVRTLGPAGTVSCRLDGLTMGNHTITVTYSGDAVNPPAIASIAQKVTGTKPSGAVVMKNPYGPLSVVGARVTGPVIDQFSDAVEIQLGTSSGSDDDALEIEFPSLDVGFGSYVYFRAGAAGQNVVLRVTGGSPTAIAGALSARQNTVPGSLSVQTLHVQNRNGISTNSFGMINGDRVVVDALGSSWLEGAPVVNGGGIVGSHVEIMAAQITGPGTFLTNDLTLRSFGNMNSPRHGTEYYANALLIQAFDPAPVAVTLNAYGEAPQVVNLTVVGSLYPTTVSMPSRWPAGSTAPPNASPLPIGGQRPAGAPDPGYGGGSLIVAAQTGLMLVGGDSNDFAFAGAIVLRSPVSIDTAGVAVNQGWTTSGRTFQGLFFEAPQIRSSVGPIAAYTNAGNWINFSTAPQSPVRAFALARNADGSASFATADTTAPHLNNYSVIQLAAAKGECWTCLVSAAPVDVYGP